MKNDAGRFIIDLARLDKTGEEISGETSIEAFDYDTEFVHPLSGVIYRVFAQITGSELLVRGSLEADFTALCSRCSKEFTFTAEVPDYTASFEINEKIEYFDLTNDVRESIILALPTYPVCREDCKGLCAKCGKDLNESPCECAIQSGDGRWNALDALVVEGNEDRKEKERR